MLELNSTIRKLGALTIGTTNVDLPTAGKWLVLIPHPDNTGDIFLHEGGGATGGLVIPDAGVKIINTGLTNRKLVADAAAQILTYATL